MRKERQTAKRDIKELLIFLEKEFAFPVSEHQGLLKVGCGEKNDLGLSQSRAFRPGMHQKHERSSTDLIWLSAAVVQKMLKHSV